MPPAPKPQRRLLGQVLKEMELVSEGQIQEALSLQRKKGGAMGEILVELGYITGEELLLASAAQNGMEVINLDDTEVPVDLIEKVPKTMAEAYGIIPVRMVSNALTIAMSNPNDINVIDDLRYTLKCDVVGAVATKDQIQRALEKYYKHKQESIQKVLKDLTADDLTFEEIKGGGAKSKAYNIDEMVNAAPVIKLLNLILLSAIKAQSSDIHFEPYESNFRVRYRVDGVLYELESPPLNLATALITRIKVLSNLDISEMRLPQDGRILLDVGGKKVDLRVSALPCIFGESVVMRVLDRSVLKLQVQNMGLRGVYKRLTKKVI